MTRYVAFLRAINVGGHVVKMEVLRKLFESMNFARVETYIASGNVIFESQAGKTSALEKKIEDQLKSALGYQVGTYLRSMKEVIGIVEAIPFEPPEIERAPTLQVGFVRAALNTDEQKLISSLNDHVHQFRFGAREVFWLCNTKMSESPIRGDLGARRLLSQATFRNINTVRKIATKYS